MSEAHSEHQLDESLPSLVVRLWIEDEGADGPRAWRGHVTNVVSGERRYVNDVAGIARFVEDQLRELGLALKRPTGEGGADTNAIGA